MTIERKVGMGIAGQPSGATDVAEVFSTYLYTGNAGVNAINNGIDLAGEGGLIWLKGRDAASSHTLHDTERGVNSRLSAQNTSAAQTSGLTSFNSNGFTLSAAQAGELTNASNAKYVSFTFRKKKKFFDVVTYTGSGNVSTGQGAQSIAHSLGSVPAMIIFKSLTTAENWPVYNKDIGNQHYLSLNKDNAKSASAVDMFNATSPTDTHFTVGTDSEINKNGESYVAYLFADNSSEDAEEQMIKVGTYTGNQSATGPVVNLGWEPQWLMVKQTTLYSDPLDWIIIDTMRGLNVGGDEKRIYANTNASESGAEICDITSTGFKLTTNGEQTNKNNAVYIYMAIRAPMMVEPTAATDVFAIDNAGSGVAPAYISGFPVDFAIYRDVVGSAGAALASRMTAYYSDGVEMFANTTAAEAATGAVKFDFMDGHFNNTSRSANYYSWMWKRAKGFMDVVCWLGDGTSNGTNRPSHSLGVVPQMIISKVRNSVDNWIVLHTEAVEGASSILLNNATGGSTGNVIYYHGDHTNYIPPTNSQFAVCTGGALNALNKNYVSYLFATLDGISKVGGYTGNGSNNHVINCGFTNGARFVLIKRSSGASQWYLFDSVRGITVGSTDPFIMLNLTNAQQTEAAGLGPDAIQPHSSGFQLTTSGDLNANSATFIFYAIA